MSTPDSPAATTQILPGSPYPLGATRTAEGTNFAVFSAHGEKVELCLFEGGGDKPSRVYALPERTYNIWHGFVPDVDPGTHYGLRVYGPYEPESGHRFNSAKLLVDPYARALDGTVRWGKQTFAYDLDDPDDDLALNTSRNDADIPKGVVIDPEFDWGDDAPPRTPWLETIIYELHIKGFTVQHPEIPKELQGTYLGLAHPAAIKHLTELGVTAVELLPVHAFVDDQFLLRRGLVNYWGYSTLGYFAPAARYASKSSGEQVSEFKQMVRALHKAGIEVILDVVYNHTCEGNHLGPTLSFKGIDNLNYYRVLPNKPRYYLDFTGTGNTLNMHHPQVLTLVMDSLRYWVQEMHVDGFRFDLASTLGRERYDFEKFGGFFDSIHQDPVLSRVKLIAEPWDVGEGGYQVGNFPIFWSEWNDRFRDGVRAFWQTDHHPIADMGYRLTGSSDLYELSGRGPWSSINFIVSHDGYTLEDLVSYTEKHNEANGEDNQDGHNHNLSANYGVEGPTTDQAILALRDRQKRNMLTTLILSQGVPMLCGGDEIGRTQLGNNNAYCQDNELSWLNWDLDDREKTMLAFVRRVIEIRKRYPILRRRRFFEGRPERPRGIKDLAWLRVDGNEMKDEDWSDPSLRTLVLRMAGDALDEPDARGRRILTRSFLFILHADPEPVAFRFPAIARGASELTWNVILDTNAADGVADANIDAGDDITIPGRCILLCVGGEDAPAQ